jgi:hypothetical protein
LFLMVPSLGADPYSAAFRSTVVLARVAISDVSSYTRVA